MIEVEDPSKRYGDKLAVPSSSDSREARLPAPGESFTISTSTRHVRRLPIPAAWQARSSRTVREWAIVSAGLAPVLLTGAYLVADILQRASYSPMHPPGGRLLSRHRGRLDRRRASARGLLTVAGLAGISIATSPEPASGSTPQHLAWTVLGAVTIAVWPAFAARRTGPRPRILSVQAAVTAVTAVFVGLLGWFVIETPGGQPPGPGRAADVIGPDLVAVRRRRRSAPRPPDVTT